MPPLDSVDEALTRYRRYLETLAFIQLDPRLNARFGLSDVIQDTLLEAYRDRVRIEQFDEASRCRWLSRMFVNNLKERVAAERAQCRDVGREQALGGAFDASTCRLERYLADDRAEAPDQLLARERAARVLDGIARLPDREREALVLQQYHGWKLKEIAERLQCTTGAVAGLHARALARLRDLLPDLMGEQ